MQPSIHIENQSNAELPHDEDPPSWISACLELPLVQSALENKPVIFSILYADKAEAQALNNEFRSKDYATNVLSFPAELPDFIQTLDDGFTLGDLVICPDVVVHEASSQLKSQLHHHAHLVIHGFLHLLGFDHEQDRDAEIMENLEVETLKKLGFPDPYCTKTKTKLQSSIHQPGLTSTNTETA